MKDILCSQITNFTFFSNRGDEFAGDRLKKIQVCIVPHLVTASAHTSRLLTPDLIMCLYLVIDWRNSNESYPQVCLHYRVTQGRKEL